MKRYIELDLLRTAAVLGMLIYHTAFDLQSMFGVDIDVLHGPWKVFQELIATTFLLLVGISFAISFDRTPAAKRQMKFLRRGLIVLGCAMAVTGATYYSDPSTYIRFGVLHLIGVSIFLLPLVARMKHWHLEMAAVIIVAHQWVSYIRLPTSFLLPLGLRYTGFRTLDYFPLIPWFGVMVIGYVIGQRCYVEHLTWRKHLPLLLQTESQKLKTLTIPGRYALMIYMIHQPVIVLILWMIFPQDA